MTAAAFVRRSRLPDPASGAAAGHSRTRVDQIDFVHGRSARAAGHGAVPGRGCGDRGQSGRVLPAARRVPDHSRLQAARRVTGNSSVYRYQFGAHPDVLDYFRSILRRSAGTSATSNPIFLTSCTVKARWSTGLLRGAQVSSITASRAGRLTTGKNRLSLTEPRSSSFTASATRRMPLPGRRNRRFRFIKPASWVTAHWVT